MNTLSLQFDKKDKDMILWQGQVVMSRSEEAYFNEIFSRLSHLKSDSVLEVGYGLGISASLIQKFLKPVRHDIVEIENNIFNDLRVFSMEHPSVRPIPGDWLETEELSQYDFIFYDPYDYLLHDNEDAQKVKKIEVIKKSLKPGGVFCHPHFGDGDVPDLPDFNTIIVERLTLAPYLVADGASCEHAAIVYHMRK